MCGGGACNYAEGGDVEATTIRPDKGFGKIITINAKDEKFAEGGEAHEDEAQDKAMMDDEMKNMMGEELMAAFDAKDSKRVMESIEAMILNCLSKE